ncbi:hypothetical protein PGT21_021636 [Puccinia graminis f. sp. tritici]|uniref:Uncharacterized protein n=1 Tax=Puccinia graminis f. sp. tritici TaxID=56615 RepID=A0A5B0RHU6_PUCGR|nr:hypothetical protein PGT21_021636 [Puccinia graminis f. sp. tritici]KAA1124533.1 hypothetical protein PGTUg99_010400 [Puccinia graminis f. sp. tritici]
MPLAEIAGGLYAQNNLRARRRSTRGESIKTSHHRLGQRYEARLALQAHSKAFPHFPTEKNSLQRTLFPVEGSGATHKPRRAGGMWIFSTLLPCNTLSLSTLVSGGRTWERLISWSQPRPMVCVSQKHEAPFVRGFYKCLSSASDSICVKFGKKGEWDGGESIGVKSRGRAVVILAALRSTSIMSIVATLFYLAASPFT